MSKKSKYCVICKKPVVGKWSAPDQGSGTRICTSGGKYVGVHHVDRRTYDPAQSAYVLCRSCSSEEYDRQQERVLEIQLEQRSREILSGAKEPPSYLADTYRRAVEERWSGAQLNNEVWRIEIARRAEL